MFLLGRLPVVLHNWVVLVEGRQAGKETLWLPVTVEDAVQRAAAMQ